jgi:Bacterial Ig domain/Calx-beta domain
MYGNHNTHHAMKTRTSTIPLRLCLAALLAIGAAPAFAQTNGTIPTNTPIVSIRATDAAASEAGDPGAFTVSRGERTNGALIVWFQITGGAMPGLDYTAIPGSVTIPDGASSVAVPVVPVDDLLPEPTETVTLRVVPSPVATPIVPYLVGLPSTATVGIADNDGFVPTNRPPVVTIISPANNSSFLAPATLSIIAQARDEDGSIVSVEFFDGDHSLGIRTHPTIGGNATNLYTLIHSNVPAGAHNLTAKATDNAGATTVSAIIRVNVNNPPPPPTNQLPIVRIVSPAPNTFLHGPATIGLVAEARDYDGSVASVLFYSNQQLLGPGARGLNSNLFTLVHSNVPPGMYDFTARATDNLGASTLSTIVRVTVVTNQPPPPPPPTNQPVVVSIVATDPHASEGLVMWCSNTVVGVNTRTNEPGWSNNCPHPIGFNTATFTVRRSGSTNNQLRVYYGIGGSASNGVDYAALSGVVVIPAGVRTAQIRINPIDDTSAEPVETVQLRLRLPPLPLDPADRPYSLGRPDAAGAFITDNDRPAPPCGPLRDGSFHICEPITNHCFRVDVTTNMVHWETICTNSIADGAARHIDCDATNALHRFYRLVPVPCPPNEP